MHQNLIPGLVFAFVVGSTSLAAAGVGPAAGRGAGAATIPGYDIDRSVNSAPGVTTGAAPTRHRRSPQRFAPNATDNAPK
jgi:hypothetical protein